MSNWRDHGPVTDEDLVAYLDGMLEDELADYVEGEVRSDRDLNARLELLRDGERPFEEAYDLLLREAPQKRLKQILKLAKEPPPTPAEEFEMERPAARATGMATGARREPWVGWRMLAAAAVLIAVFAGGLYANRLIQVPGQKQQAAGDSWSKKGWRAAVAEYQSLFITQTLQSAGGDEQKQVASMRAASNYLGIDLTADKVTVAPLELKRADVLKFAGKPLVQVAYLANGKTPVSFCIIKGKRKPHELAQEQRLGLNIVYWDTDDFGFMVIGDVPKDQLDEIARKLRRQVS